MKALRHTVYVLCLLMTAFPIAGLYYINVTGAVLVGIALALVGILYATDTPIWRKHAHASEDPEPVVQVPDDDDKYR